jgi:hypothetical protein
MSVAELGSERWKWYSNGLAPYLTFTVPFCSCEGAIRPGWRSHASVKLKNIKDITEQ